MSKSKKNRSYVKEEAKYSDGIQNKNKYRQSFKEFNDKNFKNNLKSNNLDKLLDSEYYK